MLNKEFIKKKILLIQEEFPILEKLSECSFEEIVSNSIKEAALERVLERIIMRAVDVNQHFIAELSTKETPSPRTYKETFLSLTNFKVYPQEFAEQIAKSAGTRNILVHDYDVVDYGKIYSSISDCLKDYRQYCQYLLDFLEKNK